MHQYRSTYKQYEHLYENIDALYPDISHLLINFFDNPRETEVLTFRYDKIRLCQAGISKPPLLGDEEPCDFIA